jgi:hypothetical protein
MSVGRIRYSTSVIHPQCRLKPVKIPISRTQTLGEPTHFWIVRYTAKYQNAGSRMLRSFVSADTLASCVGCDLQAVPA